MQLREPPDRSRSSNHGMLLPAADQRRSRARANSRGVCHLPAIAKRFRPTVVFRRWQKPSEILRRLRSRPPLNGSDRFVEWHQPITKPAGTLFGLRDRIENLLSVSCGLRPWEFLDDLSQRFDGHW